MASTIGIVAIGVTMLMICGEFDLSVGQNFAFTPIIWAILFVTNDMNEWLALAIALGCAAAVGITNGLVTTVFGIPSFITTLGMFFVLQGLNNLLISGHQLIMFEPSMAMSLLGARIGTTPFYMPLVWMFVIAVAFWFVLTRLQYGNWTFATGGKVGPAQGHGRAHGAGEAHQFRPQLRLRRSRGLHAVRLPARRDPGAGPELRAPCHHRRRIGRHVAVRRHGHDLGQHHRRIAAFDASRSAWS